MADVFKPSDLARRDTDRTKGYRSLLDFYHSIQWEGREKWGEKRLTFNYARVVVDKVVSYLMSGIGFSVEPIEATAAAEETVRRARAALRRVHEENSVAQLDFETEIDCAILGDACYKVTWDESKPMRFTVKLDKDTPVSGTVVDKQTGKPVAGAQVWLIRVADFL